MGRKNMNQPKPDDRSDNVEKLQDMTQETIDNFQEAEDRLQYTSGEEYEAIADKNERRKQAIDGFRQEIKDETDIDE